MEIIIVDSKPQKCLNPQCNKKGYIVKNEDAERNVDDPDWICTECNQTYHKNKLKCDYKERQKFIQAPSRHYDIFEGDKGGAMFRSKNRWYILNDGKKKYI